MAAKWGLMLRESASTKVDELMWDTFFGGSADMAARKDEHLFFKSLYIWAGDCWAKAPENKGSWTRATGGSALPGGSAGRAIAEPGGAGGWTQRSIAPSSYPNKGRMKTQDLKVRRSDWRRSGPGHARVCASLAFVWRSPAPRYRRRFGARVRGQLGAPSPPSAYKRALSPLNRIRGAGKGALLPCLAACFDTCTVPLPRSWA